MNSECSHATWSCTSAIVLDHSLNRYEFVGKYFVHKELTVICDLKCIVSPPITLSMSLKPTGVQWKVRINTMKSVLLKHSLLVCVLWLLTCCTGAASEDYRRTMWVSTTGEDSPQCIHDTPTSDPVPRPRHFTESCGSLNYALTHIGNNTMIAIGCGIHVLEPVDSLLEGTPLMNVTYIAVVGVCGNYWPTILCTDKANFGFYNSQEARLGYLVFRNCGEQLQHSDSLSDSSTLYFQDCKTVTIQYVLIIINGPYGRGISFKYNTSITHGDVSVEYVMVYHFGIHGSGIHFEVFTGIHNAKDVLNFLASEKYWLRGVYSYNINVHPNYILNTSFTGINITVMGDGGGGEITLFNVSVYSNLYRTSRGNGISVALLDAVHHYKVTLERAFVIQDDQDICSSSNRTVSGMTFDEHIRSNFSKGAANNSDTYNSIKIELRGNSTRNHIRIEDVYVNTSRVAPGSSLCIEITDHSEENVALIQTVGLRGENSSEVYSRGLQLIITGWARRNEIQVNDLVSQDHRALWGAGGHFEFSGHAMRNSMKIRDTYFDANHALRGGGFAVVCMDFATQNTFKVEDIEIYDNIAELGGGICLILQDSSCNNNIEFTQMKLYNNTAHHGGGMLIHITDASEANMVVILNSEFVHNQLLPSENLDMMGGGVHVEFSTVSATFQTDNIVTFTESKFLFNTAGHGVGGGISVLYKHSLYQGNPGDRVTLNSLKLLHNMAASGSACAFQSLPTHGKRLFRGVRMTNISALLHTSEYETFKKQWNQFVGKKVSYSTTDSPRGLFLIQLFSQVGKPSFQVETNTNMIFAKSVQITVYNKIRIHCGVSSQGIYALHSEILFQTNASAWIVYCVATHGGAIALHGESYIRVGNNVTLKFILNHAFQRGGAIYASSAPGVVPVSSCFLQYDQEWEESQNRSAFTFAGNTATAKQLSQSLYVSDMRNCICHYPSKEVFTILTPSSDLLSTNVFAHFKFMFIHLDNAYEQCKSLTCNIMSGPKYVDIANFVFNLNNTITIYFIPGKQKRLPYTHAYDEFGSNISSVFTVLINKMNNSLPVVLNSFSKYTADFTVILHGIPQQHGMAKHFLNYTSNTSAVVRPPQLVLQSVDNTDLLLVMNIELQCCPPGYIFRYGSGGMGTCLCGLHIVVGIAKCDKSHSVLKRDHWAGYLSSNDQHSCDGQKLFTGLCPPGYCQIQPIKLPENNLQHKLQNVVCSGSNRKGLLCGDCLKSKGIAVNFNGIRPVCVSCDEGLSKVGILVWILSEWVPMLTFMFVLMLFNMDLVSGRLNSFLLFAQFLAFSAIRGDVELGPVHNAFVRIYRFLYGMWNLDFFGVLLPPYCLTPHAHLTLLQTILLHYCIGLLPLTVAITLIVLERSAEKWICCHRVDQCLRRMRRWKAKYSDGMSYDRALPAFVILGFTRFLVSSSYILVNQTITGEDGERKVVVWWQGSVPYGSIQHIAYLIPAIVILLVFVLLPSFVLLTLPIGPQLFGRLIIAVPPLRKLQRMQTFCSSVYTDRLIFQFVNVFQGCYKERFRSFSSLYLFHRIVHLLVTVFISRAEDAIRIQIFLTVALLLLIATLQPYNSRKLNALDAAILGNMALILILSLHITDLNTPIGTRQFYASLQMILIYLPLLYPGILLRKKVYLKCRQLRCCQKQEEQSEDNAEPLLEAPAERLGNLVLITELRAGMPALEDDDTMTETETDTYNFNYS